MRYFQLINPIRNQYPLVGEKEIYVEENGVQTLILKRDIIANFPNETIEKARNISLEEVVKCVYKMETNTILYVNGFTSIWKNNYGSFTVEFINSSKIVERLYYLTFEEAMKNHK